MARHSVFAFLLVCGAVATAVSLLALARLLASADPTQGGDWGVTAGIYMSVYLGWPLVTGIAVERRTGQGCSRARVIASIAFPCVVAFSPCFVPLARMAEKDVIYAIPLVGGTLFGMFAMIYIPRFGAMTLVAAERGRPVRIDHYLGTFFLFYLLPIGVLLLQKRLRKLLLLSDPE